MGGSGRACICLDKDTHKRKKEKNTCDEKEEKEIYGQREVGEGGRMRKKGMEREGEGQ